MNVHADLESSFNLGYNLVHDPRLRLKMANLMHRLGDLEGGRRLTGVKYIEERNRIIASIWRDCGYNFSMLTGYFFPNYPKGRAMSMLDRPFNMALMFSLPYWSFTLRGSRQIGKALADYALVATPEGYKRMGDIRAGDTVLGGDGKPCRVLGVYRQGNRDVVRVTFRDGSRTYCDLDHNWKAGDPVQGGWRVITTRELLREAYTEAWIPVSGSVSGRRHFKSIEPWGNSPCTCIEVDSGDHTFLANDRIVTHNTTTLGVRGRIESELIRRLSSLYVAPHSEPLNTYARKLDEICTSFRNEVKDTHRFKQNLFYRKFPSGSQYDLIRVQTSATPARGKTADVVSLDECVSPDTLVISGDKLKKVVDLRVGDSILAFDENNAPTNDTVTAIKCQGRRHTWTLRLASGKCIECTSNEKIKTSRGWLYLSDLPVFQGAALQRESDAAGNPAGGWVPLHTERVQVSEVSGKPRPTAERILPAEDGPASAAFADDRRQGGRGGPPQRGLRGILGEISYADILPPAALQRHLPDPESRTTRLLDENRNPSLGRRPHLGGRGLVVHGRRLQTRSVLEHRHPLFLLRRSGKAVRLADGPRLPVGTEADQEAREALLDDHHPGGLRADLQKESPPVHAPVDALQAGLRGVEVAHLRPLRGGVRTDGGAEKREPGAPLLPGKGVPEEGREPEELGLRGEARGAEGPLQKNCGSPGEGSGKEAGGTCPGFGLAEGEIQGSGIQGGSQRVEEGLPPEAESGGEAGLGSPPQLHLSLLLDRFYKRQEPQREAGLSDPLLRRPCLPGEKEGRHEAAEAGAAEREEEDLRVLTLDGWERIVSVEYAGEQEVWDIETEEHHTFFANGIGVHNCQLLDPSLEMEILEVLNDSEIPMLLYTGTSTTFDTLLEYRYQEGTQATWQVMLDSGRTVDCGNPDAVKPCIGEYFMVDPETGKRIDPLRGYYKFNNPEGFEKRCFSIHIPQVLNPDIADNPIKWNVLYRTLARDPDKFVQEKLGIPVASGSREITEDDLKRICVPEIVGDPDERRRRAQRGYYKTIVSCADWGGSDYNMLKKTKESTTTHLVLGISPENNIHVLHAKRHGGMDYKTIMNLIAKDHNVFRAGGIATDYGVGETYHELMRSHPTFNSGRHVIFHYTGPRSPICNVMKGALANTLNLNRTESITSLILAMTMPEPMILCGDWAEMQDFLEDFLHIHRILSEKEGDGGQRQFRYLRDASKRDDTVHAMNFGYSLLRLTYNQILMEDEAARQIIRASSLGSDRAAPGSFSAPNAMNRLMEEARDSWNTHPEDHYHTDDYHDYE